MLGSHRFHDVLQPEHPTLGDIEHWSGASTSAQTRYARKVFPAPVRARQCRRHARGVDEAPAAALGLGRSGEEMRPSRRYCVFRHGVDRDAQKGVGAGGSLAPLWSGLNCMFV